MTDLFDALDDDPGGEPCSQAGESPATSSWREVPQALFLSWPERQQLAYCAARDEDAALYATTMEEALWYQERARSYR